jgi:glycerate dehydrogenase
MRIIVLDGYTLNPGDLSWGPLEALGRCEIFERSSEQEILQRAAEAEIVLTNKAQLNRGTIERLPKLKYIGILATGTNIVDLDAARERAIIVTNVPAYGTTSVAQTTIALLLELTQRTGHHSQTVREGKWSRHEDWCYWDYPLVELAGLTIGIVGPGRIGSAVAAIANAFRMKVLVWSHSKKAAPPYASPVGLEELFRQSDVVSLHCPLTTETKHLVNAERLGWMKSTAYLLNTSRGLLIDEAALADALNSERLAGAGLDVLSTEPPRPDNPLLRARNCIITPHLAWATQAARARLLKIAVENVEAFLRGQPQNLVS